MPRFKLTLEYDGGDFVGWQRQANGRSVQEALEDAVFKFTAERIEVIGAGRTDTGVHASGQIAHLDLIKAWDLETVRDAINFHIKPHRVSVLSAENAAPGFHARFDAKARAYRYVILNRRSPPALLRGQAWHVVNPLDEARMHEAAQRLIGKHDFTTFRAAACQSASPLKTLDRLAVSRLDDRVLIEAKARSFLHHQVRSFVGTLRLVGEGKWTADDVSAALAACDRARCGPVAPADGLTLVAVDY